MIALKRGRTAGTVPAAFRQPKLGSKSELLAAIFFAGQPTGKLAFDSAQWKPAKDRLKKDSKGKCAYCEAPTSVVAHGDVEHFRPKSIYWWLAFCFDNYLYSCQICNQTYKSDNFPISGNLAMPPTMPNAMPTGPLLATLLTSLTHDPLLLTDDQLRAHWQIEQADLVNPYLKDPEQLFVYEVDGSNEEVWIRSASGARANRAMAASEACLGLNREELRRERFVNYTQLAAFSQILALPDIPAVARTISEAEVRRMQAASEPFSGMRRYFARSWGLPGPPP